MKYNDRHDNGTNAFYDFREDLTLNGNIPLMVCIKVKTTFLFENIVILFISLFVWKYYLHGVYGGEDHFVCRDRDRKKLLTGEFRLSG